MRGARSAVGERDMRGKVGKRTVGGYPELGGGEGLLYIECGGSYVPGSPRLPCYPRARPHLPENPG